MEIAVARYLLFPYFEDFNPLTGEAVTSRLGGVLVFKNSL